MSEFPLYRKAGPIAVAAGILLAATHLVMFVLMEPADRVGMLTDPVFRVVNAAYFFTFCGLMAGLIAVYGRMAQAAGRLGVGAFLVAMTGTMCMAGDMWFDGFATPWLAETLPQAFTVEKTAILKTGALLAYLLFAAGWVLFGIAAWRARAFPVLISILFIAGGLCGFNAGMPPYGAPLGLAMAAAGGRLIQKDRAAAYHRVG